MIDIEISVSEAAALLSEKHAKLLDVREPWEYAKTSIEGSLLMPMGEVVSRAPEELDQKERLLVLCHHGIRSMSVAAWMRGNGFEQTQSVRGGIDAWSREVDSTLPRY
jgi:rhodanese-related sulfurtransferase